MIVSSREEVKPVANTLNPICSSSTAIINEVSSQDPVRATSSDLNDSLDLDGCLYIDESYG